MNYRYHYGRKRLSGGASKKRGNSFKRRKTRMGRIRLSLPGKGVVLVALKGGGVVLAGWLLFSLFNLGWERLNQSSLFKVREVRASGFTHLAEKAILHRVGPSLGRNLVSLDLHPLEDQLLNEPWVEAVSLHKAFPDRLFVQVVERRPVAVVTDPGGAVIVDKKGRVLDAWKRVESVPARWRSLPVVLGVRVASLRAGEEPVLETFSELIDILRTAPFGAEPQLTLAVDPSGAFRVQRQDYWLRLGKGNFEEKWERFRRMEAQLRQWDRPVQEVDLRFEGKVIVR
ncbi:MAG TPA: FtsQ-type POTRA domain-containing protein [Nitrospiria bacterium]|nr:FtsQ-type POTRA domain-containing protein [Nitrospiria bacterium]